MKLLFSVIMAINFADTFGAGEQEAIANPTGTLATNRPVATGEARFFGFSNIPYEVFVSILLIIAVFFIVLKYTLRKHYRSKGMPIPKKK